MAGEIEHAYMICKDGYNEAFTIVDGFLLPLKRVEPKKVCELHEDEEIDQWDYC